MGGAHTWPVLLVGGGSGVVPLMAMLRHHAALDHPAELHLVYSARAQRDILFREELDGTMSPRRAVTTTLTREPQASGWSGRRGRVDRELLEEVGWSPADEPRCYVCGPTPFVETTAHALVAIGHRPANIRTERFGPTGGE